MNCKLILTIVVLNLFIGFEVKSQFKIDAEYRTRSEYRDGYKKLAVNGSTPSVIISQRSRLSLSYNNENLKIKFTPQDVRIWGDEQLATTTGVHGDNASLDLFEAYAEIKMRNTTWISVGRQQIVYDNQRLLAARNWNQNGLSYDAAVLKIEIMGWNAHIGSSWNSLTESSSDNLYLSSRIKSLNYLWLNRKFNDKLNFSLLHIASGVTKTDSTNTLYFRQTTGFYSDYKNNNLNLKGNAYYQYGKNIKGVNVSAFLLDADISYKVNKVILGLGSSYLSGNKNIGGSTDKLFDVLYGARHKYFGNMDYFRTFAKDTKEGGLVDLFAYIELKFSETLSVTNTGHYFQLAEKNAITPDNKDLGYEYELLLKYKFNDWCSLESSYLFYLPTESLKMIQNIEDDKFSQFFYLTLTIKPTLFKQ